MKTFTIIGYYENTRECYAGPQSAVDAYTAMKQAASLCSDREELCIIGAIEGVHCLITPGCDNDRSAFATDLLGIDNHA